MFNISNLLNTLDNAAKETLHEGEDPPISATSLRSAVKAPEQSTAIQSSASLSDIEVTNATDSNESATQIFPKVATKAVVQPTVAFVRSSSLDAKDNEIERLNSECLDLENQVAGLKTEVQEAWNSYQAAQERAAAREAELQEEVRAVQKAKKTDKQQMLTQLTTLGNDRDEALKAMRAAQAERQELADLVAADRAHQEERHSREAALLDELNEARAGSIQGVAGLRDELRAAVVLTETVRAEHASLMRQTQTRQAELEEANAELVQGIAQKQRELARVKSALEKGHANDSNSKEMDLLMQQVSESRRQLDDEIEKRQTAERRLLQVDIELKAMQLNWEDERESLESRCTEYTALVHSLEDRLRQNIGSDGTPMKSKVYGGTTADDTYVVVGMSGSPDTSGSNAQDEIRNLVSQVQQLSKQLLHKQSTINEIQAERSALQSRVYDLQARCTNAEKQLASLREADEEENIGDPEAHSAYEDDGSSTVSRNDGAYTSGYSTSTYGLQRRRPAGSTKVIAGLEKLGVHTGPQIATMVNSIDTWTLSSGK